jgi:peptide deformylase
MINSRRRRCRFPAATYDRPVSVTPIRLFGDPVLRTPAAPVVDFDTELRQLVGDLTETMFAAGGAGLAAPQLGVGLRVFTWYVDGEVGHLVNPDVAPVGEETEEGPEGCLSIPGYRWDCRRHLHVVAGGWNMHGDPVRVAGSELLARAIQHETDHLDGVLFVDRLDAEARVAALAALEEAEWAGMAAYLPAPAPVVKVSPH